MSFFALANTGNAQVILLLEDMTEVRPYTYYVGSKITVKTVDYPEEWQTIRITKLLDESSTIVYDGGLLNTSEIISVRRNSILGQTVGYTLQAFGAAWTVFGVLGSVFGDSEYDVGTALIGVVSFATGWVIRKYMSSKKYKIGSKNRLKILDVSFPDGQQYYENLLQKKQ